MLFQGEEWGASTPFFYFTDYQEPELANAVREGRCREFAAFGWKPEDTADPQAPETFERSKLKWDEISQSPHAEILDWHKKLIQLRRSEPDLSDGDLKKIHTTFDEESGWLVAERGSVSIVCNFSDRSHHIPVCAGEQRTLISSEAGINAADGFASLPTESVAVLKLTKV
jgi:maltooligosyltrehalose trehalohydrolase